MADEQVKLPAGYEDAKPVQQDDAVQLPTGYEDAKPATSGGASGSWEPEGTVAKVERVGSKAANVAMQPLLPAGRAEKEGEAYADSAPTKSDMDSPIWTGVKKGVAGAYGDTMKTARGMLTSPLGLATIGLGGVAAEGAEAVPTIAKTAGVVSKGAGIGFGAQGLGSAYQGGKKIVQNVKDTGGLSLNKETAEGASEALGGLGQAGLAGSAELHGTDLGNTPVDTAAGIKKIATAPVRATAGVYNTFRNSAPYVIPALGAVKGGIAGGPVGAIEGAAFGTYAGNRLKKLLPEASETVGLPKPEVNIDNLKDKVNVSQKEYDKAAAERSNYAASEAKGISPPREVVRAYDKAASTLSQDKFHLETALGKEGISPTVAPPVKPLGSARVTPKTPGAFGTARAPEPEITPADVKSTPGTSMSPEGRKVIDNHPVRIKYDQGVPVEADGRHRVIQAIKNGETRIQVIVDRGNGPVETTIDPKVLAKEMGVTEESLKNTDAQQSYRAGNGQPREVIPVRPAPKELGFDMSTKTGPDIGQIVRGGAPPTPRGERRVVPRTPEQQETQELFGKARKELGEDATGDQIMARVDEMRAKPAETVGTAEGAKNDTDLFQKAKTELGPDASISDIAKRAQEMKEGKVEAAKVNPLAEGANAFNRDNGRPPVKHEKVETSERAKEIADEYDKMKHNPNDPAVKESYDSLKNDIDKQWDYATQKMGVTFEPWEKEGQPYATSKEMTKDAKDNKHVYFFKGGEMPADHPLSAVDPKSGLTYNDKFRAIHDLFGHAVNENTFGPQGEERAFNEHSQMMSPESIPAMTTETRGQNSWFNFGKHLRDEQGSIADKGQPGYKAPNERPYAEQKAGILPDFAQERPGVKTAEKAPEEVLNHIKSGKDYAILQAENPGNERISDEENAKRNAELEKDLRDKGYKPQPVGGHTKDVEGGTEHAFFVPDIKPADSTELGKKYGQAASLTNEGLHDLKTGEVQKADNAKMLTGEEAKKQGYYTTVGDQHFSVPLEEARAETKASPEDIQSTRNIVTDLAEQPLIKAGQTYDVDHGAYDFSKRDANRHRVDRDRFVNDVADKIPDETKQKLVDAEKAFDDKDNPMFSNAERNGSSKAVRAKAIWDAAHAPDEGDINAKLKGQGPAPKATAETAKMSDEELLKHGYTKEDIDAGLHLPKTGGAAEGKNATELPDEASRLMTDQERAGVTKTEKGRDNFVAKLAKLPDVQEFTDIALAGEGGRKWYQRGTQAFNALAKAAPDYFKEEGDQKKFIDLLSAGSPQQSVKMNLQEALRVWTKYVDSGRPEGKPLERMLNKEFTLSGAKTPNAMKALAGEDLWPDISKNNAFKVPSFAANLKGWLNHVTNDGWMALFGGMGSREIQNATSYHPLAIATRAAAESLGWEPAEAQAAIWAFTKAFTEHGETDPEQIKQYSEDYADIIAHDKDIQQQLRELGVNQETLNEHLRKVEPKPEVSGRTTPTTADSIARLGKRIERAGRDLPAAKDQGTLNFRTPGKGTEFNPEELEPKPKRRIRK